MPIVQIDWQKIKSRLADDTALYALTLRQASMLLGLSEQLTWEKTFRVDDYDWADKDILDADIADLQRNLAMPTNLVDIIQYIDEIEDILRALEQHAGCCDAGDISDGDHFTDSVTDGVGDVPQNIIDAGYATDAADWTGFADYKCMIAHVTVDQLEIKTREISKAMDKESTTYAIIGGIAVLTGIITHIFTAGLSTLTVAILTSLGATSLLYKTLLDWELMEDLADDVATNHDALACAFYFSDGVDDSISQLKAKIDELFSAPQALVLKNLNIAPTVKALYAGRYDQADIAAQLEAIGYDTADFDCSCTAQIGTYLDNFDFESGVQGWGVTQWGRWDGGDKHSGSWSMVCSNLNQANKLWTNSGTIRSYHGFADTPGKTLTINRVSFWYIMHSAPILRAKLIIDHDGGITTTYFANSLTWAYADIVFTPGLVITSVKALCLVITTEGTPAGIPIYVDDITLDYDVVE